MVQARKGRAMADSGDRRLIEAIGYTVSEHFSRQQSRIAYLVDARSFWNKNRKKSWKPEDLSSVRLTDPHIIEFGYFLYEQALVARHPDHQWQSPFDREASLPHRYPTALALTDSDLPLIEKRAECQLAIWARSRLIHQMQDGEISASEAAAEVARNQWPPIPATLASVCELPKGKWLPLGDTIVALITGQPSSPSTAIDQRLAPDIIRLATDCVIEGAFADVLHLHGKKGCNSEVSQIDSWRFQTRPVIDWRTNRLSFTPPQQRTVFLTPRYRSASRSALEVWNDVLVEVPTLEQWLALRTPDSQNRKSRRHMMSPAKKTNLSKEVQRFLVERYNAIPADQPFPNETEDHMVVNSRFGIDVPRDDVFRPARRAACCACGRDAKPGPRRKKTS
jgi:hypothetical protein